MAKIKVYTPNPYFTGVRNTSYGEVQFEEGVAVVNKQQADELVKVFGYSLEPIEVEKEDQEEAPVEQSSSLSDTLRKRFDMPEASDEDLLNKIGDLDTAAGIGSIFIKEINASLGLPDDATIKKAVAAIEAWKEKAKER